MPALYDRDEQGREGLLNYRLQGNFVVVDGVPETLVMRLGKDTAVLVNKHPLKPLRVAER
jgi:type IV secretion system protein VirB9